MMRRNRGAAGQQYAIIVGLVGVVALVAVGSVGDNIKLLFGTTGNVIGTVTNASMGTTADPGPGGPANYPFTAHTFTTCGASGVSGPDITACRDAYSTDWEDTAYFAVETGIQKWTVPATGLYRITAAGAKGGNAIHYPTQHGGYGAIIAGSFSLTQGEVLNIVVGQVGGNETNSGHGGGGGGGGSFVYTGAIGGTGLKIAAGGGGGQCEDGSCNGPNGSTTTAATACGGSVGNGGPSSNGGGGGAGWHGNGAVGAGGSGASGGGGRWAGGVSAGTGLDNFGGFGGGGGANNNESGGGGGYTGGCGSGNNGANLGGGGSYNSGTNQATGGTNDGPGQVTIERLP